MSNAIPVRLGVLASGRGSNFSAIVAAIGRGGLSADVRLLASDIADAPALDSARKASIEAVHIPYVRGDRRAFENRVEQMFDARDVQLVVLAGFMRLITPDFIRHFDGRILNIHPSLLPSFKGLHAQRQALDAGVKISGCTVHVVTAEMDAGPILGQRAVPVLPGDTEDTLSSRILAEEHRLFPACIREYATQLGTLS
jgi:phosphoribosylglycinamide formyltransferase-1